MLREPFWADFRLEDGQSITKISYSANGLHCFLAHSITFGKRSIFRKVVEEKLFSWQPKDPRYKYRGSLSRKI